MTSLEILDSRVDGGYLDLLVRTVGNQTLMVMRTKIFDSNILPEYDSRTHTSRLTGSIILDIQQLEKIPAAWLERMRQQVASQPVPTMIDGRRMRLPKPGG